MKRLLFIPLIFICSTLWAADSCKEPIQLARTNPYIAGAGVAATSCELAFSANDTDANIASSLWARIILAANALSCSGTQIRITLEAHSTESTIISGTSIGVRSGTTEDTVAEPIRITWDTGGSTKTITAGATAISDWINFTFTKTNAHLITVYMADNGTQYYRRDNGSDTYYYRVTTATDVTLVADATAEDVSTNRPFITKIEVQ